MRLRTRTPNASNLSKQVVNIPLTNVLGQVTHVDQLSTAARHLIVYRLCLSVSVTLTSVQHLNYEGSTFVSILPGKSLIGPLAIAE